MSIRSLAVCAIVILLAGCYKQEQVNAVQHPSAWQRQAGESPQAAAAIIKQSEQNTQQLTQAIQSGKSDDIAAMSGKLARWTAKSPSSPIRPGRSRTTPAGRSLRR